MAEAHSRRAKPQASLTRRLACAMFADIVGYTRLMEANEEQMHLAFGDIVDNLVRPALGQYRGRLIKSTGDGFLAEFASAVDAVRCGLAIQAAMTAREAAPQIAFRIGIHLGEIIEGSDDIFGRDVNLAARLQAICEPEGLCISNAVHEAIAGTIAEPFEDWGARSLRNIDRLVHVWHWMPQRRSFALPDPAAPGPPPLPARPSLAVLPFANMSGDAAQEYFADGLVQEIIGALSRVRWLFVIARNSTFTYKGRAVDIRQVGRELGVRYVLEGSVRKSDGEIRISAQLIDGETGNHLWTETINSSLTQIFEVQGIIAQGVAGAIEPKLRSAEIERARKKPTTSLDAYDLYLRALPSIIATAAGDLKEALRLLERAVALDPRYALAHAAIAWCRYRQMLVGAEPATAEFLAAATLSARRAVELDPADPELLSMAAIVVAAMGKDYVAATEWIDISLRLNPNSSVGWSRNGFIRCWIGDYPTAIESFNRAMRLSPFDPMTYLFQTGLGMAYTLQHNWPLAIDWLRRALSNNRHYAPSYRFLAVALVQSGRVDEARRLVAELSRLDPLSSLGRSQLAGIRDEEPRRLYVESLRLAGLPE